MEKTAKELAFALFDQGKRPKDAEVKALDIKARSRYTYFQLWKSKAIPKDSTPPPPEGKRTPLGKRSSSAIEVGKITITSENWGFTQYGAILILDTYHQAKRDINYGGTVGEFLCDITEFYRRLVNYKEVQHGGGDGEGGISPEEDGRTSPEPSRELVPQQ